MLNYGCTDDNKFCAFLLCYQSNNTLISRENREFVTIKIAYIRNLFLSDIS